MRCRTFLQSRLLNKTFAILTVSVRALVGFIGSFLKFDVFSSRFLLAS